MSQFVSRYFIVFLACIGTATASADFYILPSACKMLLVSLDDGSIKTGAGDPPSYECIRRGERIGCTVSYASGGKSEAGTNEIFQVLIDSPPFLYFGSDNGATLFSVNLSTRIVGFTARLTDVNFIGEKVCSAHYRTSQEVDLLKNRRNKK